LFKWFKASAKTASEVVSGLTAAGMAASGQEWFDGTLNTGQLNGVDYVDFAAVNSFSTFGGIWAVNVLNVLPVTWISVQAIPENNNTVTVKWATASELNNVGFVVERSHDGRQFEAIASVAGQGSNSSAGGSYSIIDINVTAGTTYYYRVRQTDIDGRISYSIVVTARLSSGSMRFVQISPNPVAGALRYNVNVARPQQLEASIMDLAGRVLSRAKLTAQSGNNKYTMELSGFTSGSYLLKIIGEDGKPSVEKFIIP
jgi:hypothetical protein